MLSGEDIAKLAALARIALDTDEREPFAKDLDPVLLYVGEVGEVTTGEEVIPVLGDLRNVMREDVNPHEGGSFTKAIMGNAPRSEDGYMKVPPIL